MKTYLRIFLGVLFCASTSLYSQEGPRTEPGPVLRAKSVPAEVFENRDFLAELGKHIGGAATEGSPEGFDTTVQQQNLEPGLTKYELSFKSIFLPVTPTTSSSFNVLYNENVDLWSQERVQVTPGSTEVETVRILPSKDRALLAFSLSKKVKRLIKKAQKEGLEVAPEKDAALLRGSCGFVGCLDTFLVTQALRTRGANKQTKVVAAAVTVGAGDRFETGKDPVRVLDEDQLLELVRE